GLTSFAPILCSQHALTIPLCREYRIYQGESPETAYKKEETRFEWFNIDGTNRLLPKSRTEFTDGVKSWEETILSRDCLGNISSIKETGKPLTSIIWSWSGRYPAAIVKNAGIEVVAAAVGTQSDLDSLARNPLPDNHTLARIITGLSDSLLSETHTTTYTFIPGIGLSSVTVPSGMTTIYEYDNAGRLSAVKDGDGRKLEGYIYNLLNSGNNRLSMRSRTFRDTTGVSYSENVKWWNTLGLATQDISIAGAGDGRDLVTAYSHDFLFHDDAMIWLPYPESGTSGDFQTSASSSAKAYHSNDLAYFQKTYEKSSRDKILAESLPGYAGTHQTVYATDVAAGFPYTIWSDSGLIANGTYNSSDVARDIVTDADGRVRSTYRDLAGRTLGISSGNEQPTLYIYDESDRLKAVVGSGTELTDTLDMWRYGYDNRGRLKSKGVPGSIREFYEYDEEDRIIRRSRGQESVEYEYDDFGRVLKKYLVHTSSSGDRMLIEENCYDRYYPSADSLLFLADGAMINYGPSKGLLTSSRLAETGPSGEISGFVHRVILYDRKERPVTTVTSWPDGTILKENFIYTFSGEIASSSAELIHGNVTDMMTESFNYDIRGRKTASSSALSSDDSLSARADVQYHYDILGRPSGNDISVNGTQILSSADSLAMQGWTVSREIKAAQTPVFSESLIYDGESSLAGVSSSFTGLITEKDEPWFGQDGSIGQGRKEGFVYNHAGMLVRVCCETGNANYSYDARGNILSTGGQLDSCLFHYSGNRITDVLTSEGTQAFFAHDIYGRMTSDGVSGISIAYNFMDLPSSVSDSIGILVEYSYLADGSKTGALREDGTGLIYRGPFVYRRSASGDLELESVAFGHGRLTPDGLLLHITDHLGNVRAVLDASDGIIYEKADYSAYGDRSSLISEAPQAIPAGATLRYRFTGKEDQGPDFNVPYTDFGARMYSPALCRWLTPDPLSEKYYGISPYVYCAGNPVNFLDPDGRFPDTLWDVANVIMDINSLIDNIKQGKIGAAAIDGVGLVADAIASAVPIVPGGAGAAIKAIRGIDNASDVVRESKALDNVKDFISHTARGRKMEAYTLNDIKMVKNTRKVEATVDGENIKTIPDALKNAYWKLTERGYELQKGIMVEIKDVKALYNTKQIRAQAEYAKSHHLKYYIYTGKKTHISKNLPENAIIKRKQYLGPKTE
ncbi:MAG: RHS repeat-associated core domain-containing protein, partial [Candidatus Cryptobacteroides sp.]